MTHYAGAAGARTDDRPQSEADKQGWAGYLRERVLFVKRFPCVEGAKYPDYGCNAETYTEGSFMELESLAAPVALQPRESVTHVER